MNHKKYSVQISLLLLLLFSFFSQAAETVSQADSDAARIQMLEKALAPETPKAVASLFAKANKTRNGAVQFMMFSDQLKTKYQNEWPYWVSGTSSPWITSYTIDTIAQKVNVWQFRITYQWATASGPFQPPLLQTITVEPVSKDSNSSQTFWITHLE